ncbi:MAG TPA: Spy/CpxP family protein refolding chaperone [Sedimentisphaerales bacterium]|nr:Spy/CpxP family protein refolding chaperone [Sedimentisphaerales bacterium]
MKNVLQTTILLAVVAAIIAAAPVFAAEAPTAPPPPPPARERTAGPAAEGGQGMRGMGGFGAPLWGLVQRLELDEAQRTQVRALQTANVEKNRALRQSIMDATMKLTELSLTGGAEADIRTAANELGKASADQALLQAAALKEVRAILTAEQSARLDELIKESIAQMAARRAERRDQQQEPRREVRERPAREGRPGVR